MPRTKKHFYDILTIFPEAIQPYLNASILGRAQEKGLIELHSHDLRTWSEDKKHRKVDDTPYGGGPGMVMQVGPFDKAVKKIRRKGKKTRVILLSASGTPFTEQEAHRLAEYDQLIFLCGRYEGVDARVEEVVADESISIGPYVLTGGELPALVILDTVARLIPGVLGDAASLDMESHDEEGILEYPQYTKPAVYPFKDKKGKKQNLIVPDVLLSGDHKKIAQWREENRKKLI